MLTLCLLIAHAAGQSPTDDFTKMGPIEIKKGIEKRHPAAYYILALKLFEANQKDEGVFWFYAGQLRYRFHVAAKPDLDPSGDPALLASLNETVGRPINEYAFGDLRTLEATLENVMKWDRDTPNGFTSKENSVEAWNKTRSGLRSLVTYIDQNESEIRKQRTAKGLPNR